MFRFLAPTQRVTLAARDVGAPFVQAREVGERAAHACGDTLGHLAESLDVARDTLGVEAACRQSVRALRVVGGRSSVDGYAF
ncbi:hypothetical protein [Streptomyces sp. NPDC057909]|uniref:hypothetical protein n=1 Tax=Streptomyces sp. NPDC057909 TaxID=3346277 RepID=UPI0036EA79DF